MINSFLQSLNEFGLNKVDRLAFLYEQTKSKLIKKEDFQMSNFNGLNVGSSRRILESYL